MTQGRVDQATGPGALRNHDQRIQALERQVGRWVYVLPVPPADPPINWVAGDPLAPSFQNGWANMLGQQPASFRLHPATVVQLRGGVTGGTAPSVVFTLPERYRPNVTTALLFPGADGTAAFTGRVDPNGDVWIIAVIATL